MVGDRYIEGCVMQKQGGGKTKEMRATMWGCVWLERGGMMMGWMTRPRVTIA